MNTFPLKSILFEMGTLISIAIIGGLLFNHLRPHGIVLWGGLNAAPKAPVAVSVKLRESMAVDGAISNEIARALFRSGEALFVDARSPESYLQGHIPGAVSLPLGSSDEMINAFLTDHGTTTVIVTYCSGIYCPDAEHLAALLKDFGYTQVAVFMGGMEAWRNEGLPVE